jgi:DNA topoisomerase I
MAGPAAALGAPRRARLRRSDCSGPGIRRVRRGRGFGYIGPDGQPVRDADEILRIKELTIPPAWQSVWICSDPQGHLQATGIDAAGRKQYLYHPQWREQQDRRKFDHMLEFAGQLPTLRRRLMRTLRSSEELDRERVRGAAARRRALPPGVGGVRR